MVALGFGWSAGDIVQSIRVIWIIVEAFDSAKGSKKGYAESRAFLRALVPVLQRIRQYLEEPQQDAHKQDMEIQARTIGDAYAVFEAHLDKRLGLSSRSNNTKFVAHTLLWALDDISEKVQKLKSKVVDAVAFLGPILAFEIRFKVDNIAMELKADASNRDGALQQVTQLLTDIHDQTEALSQFSRDYDVKLQKSLNGVRDQNEQDMGTLQKSMKLIEDSQAGLAESLAFLSKQIEEQRQQSASQAEADEWTQLQGEAQTQTTSLSDMQVTTSQSLNGAAQTLQGLSALDSGNGKLATTSNKVAGLSNTFDGFGKLGGLFGGFGGKKSNESTSPQRQTPTSPARPRPAMNPPPAYTRTPPAPRENIPRRDFAPPPRRLPPARQNTNSGTSNRVLSPSRPTMSLIKATPPPLPPRSPSEPVILIDEGVEDRIEDRPHLPPRPRQRPAVPKKSATLCPSPTSPKLAADTISQSPSSLLAQHGRPASSPVVPLTKRTPSITLPKPVATQNNNQPPSLISHPPSASSMPSPGLTTSPSSSIRSTGSFPPRTPPTSYLGIASPEHPSKGAVATKASSCEIPEEKELETMSFAERRRRIQGFYIPDA